MMQRAAASTVGPSTARASRRPTRAPCSTCAAACAPGLGYRRRIRNTSDEILPLHLQRHRLEIVQVAGTPTAGVLKDVVTVGPHQQLEIDFVADSGGPALFYCTRQLHRDFGLMALIELT